MCQDCKPQALQSCCAQASPQLQVVLCAAGPIDVPGTECVTYELEDLGVDNVAQILTSVVPQVMPLSNHICLLTHLAH